MAHETSANAEPAIPAPSFAAGDASVQPFRVPLQAFLTRHFATPTGPSTTAPNTIGRPPGPPLLATGAIVFDAPLPRAAGPQNTHDVAVKPPRVLLIQRAAHDSMPLLWETPGGGCDDDESILHSCARELREEAGLDAIAIGPLVPCPRPIVGTSHGPGQAEQQPPESGDQMGGQFFLTRRGRLVCKFYFVVDVVPTEQKIWNLVPKLDPEEHQNYVWATEEEVQSGQMAGENGVRLKFTTSEQRDVLLEAFKLWK